MSQLPLVQSVVFRPSISTSTSRTQLSERVATKGVASVSKIPKRLAMATVITANELFC
jgi:hypothetical protein